jgi:crotonobetainyl-CoA:carnitine CoA-transferase CaiB-like acyl-CoA transferase
MDGMTHGPLHGLRVFDMTRILAGPSATQLLGDMGAEILKIEKPGSGDDTRAWGPPYLKDRDGVDTAESAYYLSANRNKKSISLDFTTADGFALAKRLIAQCDVLVENFRTGTLEKYGLSYAQLKDECPALVYCSITGFGQTGPMAQVAGYDFMVQGMGGIMSLTGEPDGAPMKTGVAVADMMAGMYAATGILAALHRRADTGRGQHIDISLLDTQVAWLGNAGQYYLTSGTITPRMGNAHPTIVPYEAFEAADGFIILAVGNDRQFQIFCDVAGLAHELRFEKNADRVRNRAVLVPLIQDAIKQRGVQDWIAALEAKGVPCGPVNTLDKVFAHPQVQARGMTVHMKHAHNDTTLIASPLKFSDTPVSYRHAPPVLGQDTDAALRDILQLNDGDIAALREKGAIR